MSRGVEDIGVNAGRARPSPARRASARSDTSKHVSDDGGDGAASQVAIRLRPPERTPQRLLRALPRV